MSNTSECTAVENFAENGKDMSESNQGSDSEYETNLLFTYGTLSNPTIFQRVTNESHKIIYKKAVLRDYQKACLENEVYPACIPKKGRFTRGMIIDFSSEELRKKCDRYEGSMYRREIVDVEVIIDGETQLVEADCYMWTFLQGKIIDYDWNYRDFVKYDLDIHIDQCFQ